MNTRDLKRGLKQDLKLAELIINSSPAILFRRLAADHPENRKMTYVSPNISRFGYSADDFLTGTMMFRDIVYPGDSERTLKEIKSFVEKGIEEYTQFYRIVTKRGKIRWVEDRTSIYEDDETGNRYHQGIVIDIHDRKVAEEKLRESEEKYRQIVETTGEGFLLMDRDLKIMDLNSAYTRMVGIPRSNLIKQNPFEDYSNEFQSLQNLDHNEKTCQQHIEVECKIKTRDHRMLPVLVQANSLCSDTGDVIGIMAFVTDLSSQKEALYIAGEVQQSLLPKEQPNLPGLDIAGRSFPCDEVGGDYFDYLPNHHNGNHKVSVVIGDISGHGVGSALLMCSARAFLRMRTSQTDNAVDIIKDMNLHMTKDAHNSGRFMTLFYLAIDADKSSISWVRAGHDPALFYNAAIDRFEELKGPGLALGVDEDFEYQLQQKNEIKTGQIIFLGTDGIWEATNASNAMFGKKRIQTIIRKNASHSAQKILSAVIEAHRNFTEGKKPEDDVTAIVIKFV